MMMSRRSLKSMRSRYRMAPAPFEMEPPSISAMASRRADVLAKGLPYLVVEIDRQVIGYAYCIWFEPRPAYRFSAEDSISVSPRIQKAGVGRALLAELVARAQAMGIRKLIAVIGDSRNAGSVGVHRSVGFSEVGVLKWCGWKFGQWLDVVLMERSIGLGDSAPPAPGQ